ncbi:uncharacterized protein EDB91DRAFT_1085139 [Suillus paluster]|uniref:uncharacterized protein n=1 Tax=Suillus paluster TaxID=48578 RepID=UPI001B85FBE8|nr:uncharacterized protein EDB91DRAFT_1085139 [Suillus paluster]KAG1731198.1 hypothetical protein EDB91DRAFT_1085139 [Suillus paluster]
MSKSHHQQLPTYQARNRGVVIKDPFADNLDVSDAYNPCRDDPIVFIDPASADDFHVGLGLCGTTRTPRVSKHPRDCFWYLEDIAPIFPSFYTESEVEIDLGQTTDNDDL